MHSLGFLGETYVHDPMLGFLNNHMEKKPMEHCIGFIQKP